MTRTPPRQLWTFFIFHWLEITPTQFVRVPPGISFEPLFFFAKRDNLWGKKRTALLQTDNWEKSSFFNVLVQCTCICTDVRKCVPGGIYAPPPPWGKQG